MATASDHDAEPHDHRSKSHTMQADTEPERKASVVSITLDDGAFVPGELLDLANLPSPSHPRADTGSLLEMPKHTTNEQHRDVDYQRQSSVGGAALHSLTLPRFETTEP